MKVNLDGLIKNSQKCLQSSRDGAGPMFAYCLGELRGHIQDVVDGKATFDEFADFYCLKESRSESNKRQTQENGTDPA